MPTARSCAGEILEAVPLTIRFIRRHMRSHRLPGVSVPQFRLLAFLGRHDAATLSAAADHLGLSLPSLSRMASSLVAQGLITRRARPRDRREVSLRLTPKGQESLRRARRATQSRLTDRLVKLSPRQIAALEHSMKLLRIAFDPAGKD